MARDNRVSDIRHAQRESSLQREISNFIVSITQDDKELEGLMVVRVKLSPERSKCTVYVSTPGGKKGFEALRPQLVLYRESMRSSLAKSLGLRYTPQIRFVYDEQFEEQRRINELIDDLKDKGKL